MLGWQPGGTGAAMTTRSIIRGLAGFALLVLVVGAFARTSQAETVMPSDGYLQMRGLWLKGAGVDVPASKDGAYFAAMEFTLPRENGTFARIVVLAGAGGDASVYFESDNARGVGGFVGGIGHDNIAADAKRMVDIVAGQAARMTVTSDFPLAANGKVRFLLATRNGLYTAEMDERAAQTRTDPFFALYAAGQDIITDFRKLNQP